MSDVNQKRFDSLSQDDLQKIVNMTAALQARYQMREYIDVRISNLTSGGDTARETENRVHELNIMRNHLNEKLEADMLAMVRIVGTLVIQDDGKVKRVVGYEYEEHFYLETDEEIIEKELEKYHASK